MPKVLVGELKVFKMEIYEEAKKEGCG